MHDPLVSPIKNPRKKSDSIQIANPRTRRITRMVIIYVIFCRVFAIVLRYRRDNEEVPKVTNGNFFPIKRHQSASKVHSSRNYHINYNLKSINHSSVYGKLTTVELAVKCLAKKSTKIINSN